MTIKKVLPLVVGTGTRGIAIELTGSICKGVSESVPSIRGRKRRSTILEDIYAAESYLKKAIEIKEQRRIELGLLVDKEISSTVKV